LVVANDRAHDKAEFIRLLDKRIVRGLQEAGSAEDPKPEPPFLDLAKAYSLLRPEVFAT
jgi:hypothetical protein